MGELMVSSVVPLAVASDCGVGDQLRYFLAEPVTDPFSPFLVEVPSRSLDSVPCSGKHWMGISFCHELEVGAHSSLALSHRP